MLGTRDVAPQEYGVLIFTHRHGTKFAHAIITDHRPRNAGGLLEIAVDAITKITSHHFLRNASAHRHRDLVEQFLFGLRQNILRRQIGRAA